MSNTPSSINLITLVNQTIVVQTRPYYLIPLTSLVCIKVCQGRISFLMIANNKVIRLVTTTSNFTKVIRFGLQERE